jgi:hypothetical protein
LTTCQECVIIKAQKEKEIIKMVKINYKEVCVITQCPFCGRGNEIEVNEADYWDWDDGMLAQDAFPYLSADEREMLISGICPTCWDSMFGGEE